MLACLILLTLAGVARAATPLTLAEVLRASAQHSPAIVEAMARERAASGRELSANGAFDLVFDAEAQVQPFGYYDGSTFETKVTSPLRDNGGNLYGSYRVSRGNFPGYEAKGYTNQLGEVKVGALFALLRDRVIDERRTTLGLAAADVELARLDRELVAVGVQRRAMAAYQQWVAAGNRVAIYRELLALATERQTSIDRLIALGARPAILGVENRQNIVRRNSLLVRSEQELAVAANALSFFWRNELGEPQVPGPERLPNELPRLEPVSLDPASLIRPDRPDLSALITRLDQLEARRRLAENQLDPRLDLRVEASKDIGAVGLGGPTRTPAEGFVGLRFSVPLQRRQAKGRVAEVQAEQEALQARRRLLEDQIQVEVRGLTVQVDAAAKLVTLAEDETRLSANMADAERRRFTLGASDFILVNLREEAAADARLRLVDAQLRESTANAELIAATIDVRQLGL
nr:TolC family protein [Novosphingobium piscinae]